MWLRALGSAIHNRSSYTSTISVNNLETKHWCLQQKEVTYTTGAVPTNDIPKTLEEPLLRRPSFFDQEIPLVTLRVFAFSATDLHEAG